MDGLDHRYQKRRCCWITWKLKLKYHIAAKGSDRSFIQINWVRRDLTEVVSHWLNMDCLDWACPYVYFSLKRRPWKGEQKCLFQKSKMSQSTEADHFLTNMHKHCCKCNIFKSKTRVFTKEASVFWCKLTQPSSVMFWISPLSPQDIAINSTSKNPKSSGFILWPTKFYIFIRLLYVVHSVYASFFLLHLLQSVSSFQF